ncbi:hypothetical protein PCL1606_13610 [Pseudomonas chlororaphis]|uniref:Uncharacterized protein n=1 Tax=Pseudomonas chlororaphis TaxID=587753 RepID=A0A0D5XUQ0_9PSED|nr:hypothetical protein PCL1606_13610 [Pseudomonas chlororaphis]
MARGGTISDTPRSLHRRQAWLLQKPSPPQACRSEACPR